MTSEQILNRERALTGLYHLTTKWYTYTIKLYDGKVDNFKENAKNLNIIKDKPGTFFISEFDNRISVCCSDRKSISFSAISVDNKKRISAKDFKNGYLKKDRSLFIHTFE